MILYHGSNIMIEKIDLSQSKPNKDFGKGFYLSEHEEQAVEMAKYKSSILGGEIVITRFEFNPDILKDTNLKVKIFPEYSEEWADFVLANRDGKEVSNFDIVYGPIANDGVAYLLGRFEEGTLTIEELSQQLTYKDLNSQYFFGTEKALKSLKRL